jgi:hypothetical protein
MLDCTADCTPDYPDNFSESCGGEYCEALGDYWEYGCCSLEDDMPFSLEADRCAVNTDFYYPDVFSSPGSYCVQLNQPGAASDACADIEVDEETQVLRGCCSSLGICGGTIENPPIGCAVPELLWILYRSENFHEIECEYIEDTDEQ